MLEKEYKYFKKNEKELIKKYLGKYIVIKKDKVIGVYNSLDEAVSKSLKNNELGTFFVKKIEKEERVLQFFNKVFV